MTVTSWRNYSWLSYVGLSLAAVSIPFIVIKVKDVFSKFNTSIKNDPVAKPSSSSIHYIPARDYQTDPSTIIERVKENDPVSKPSSSSIRYIPARDHQADPSTIIKRVKKIANEGGLILDECLTHELNKHNPQCYHTLLAVTEDDEIEGFISGEVVLATYPPGGPGQRPRLNVSLIAVSKKMRNNKTHRVGTNLLLRMIHYLQQKCQIELVCLTLQVGQAEDKKTYQKNTTIPQQTIATNSFYRRFEERFALKTLHCDYYDYDHNEWDRKFTYFPIGWDAEEALKKIYTPDNALDRFN